MERAAVGNASDEGQVRNAARQNKSDAALLRMDWNRVLSTGEGQRVIWAIMEHCGMNVTPYSQLSNTMAFKVGKQDIGNHILAQIMDSKPGAYLEMMTYAAQKNEQKKRPSKKELAEEAVVNEGKAITESTEDDDDGN